MPPIDFEKIHPSHDPHFARFPSRRSTVVSAKGAVATSQSLACNAAIEILNKGGNAADAAVACAAAMNVCEPTCTGIGGDMFCLFWDAKAKKVRGINGSGRSPKALTLEYLRSRGIKGDSIPLTDLNSVTVPGAAAGWLKTVKEFGSGKLSMEEILAPAIRMAREGIPEAELNSQGVSFRSTLRLERAELPWIKSEKLLKNASPNWREMMMKSGHAPLTSNIMTHPELAETFEAVAKHGHDGFYKGRIAESIVELIKSQGGLMTTEDLAECQADVIQPISYDFRNGEEKGEAVTLWECPPNGQGLTALMALGIVEAIEREHNIDILALEHNSTEYLHILIEAMRLAFADTRWYVTDPDVVHVPVKEMLSKEYLAERAKLFNPKKAGNIKHGNPVTSSDTIYLTTADSDGNACSFIASNYAGFGTGAIPKGCGFTLQNRGSNFTLREGHPNNVKGGKRPYHTIIPAMATKGEDLVMSYGVMGGFMQPQGHVQVLFNKLRGFTPQESLDAPRFCISAGLPDASVKDANDAGDIDSEIWLEEGISPEVVKELRKMGHSCQVAEGYRRAILGRGQIIQLIKDPSGRRVWACGSDLRADGCAMGQI